MGRENTKIRKNLVISKKSSTFVAKIQQQKIYSMEIQEFVVNFANQFDDTELEVFSPETRFRDLEEWSSFLALAIMAMVMEEYGVALTAEEMRNANTIQELYDVVSSLL